MPFGAEPDGPRTRFRLWAPAANRVDLVVTVGDAGREHALAARDGGWFEATLDAGAGTRYAYRIDGGRLVVPDPASRFNPDDVHAASCVVDPQGYAWQDAGWKGRPWEQAAVYELHVGTFTREGSFAAVSQRLDHLQDLGVTAIELMPVADFPGRRSWGYDGVLPFAPDASYGTPDDLKRLVDGAHARGLMVLLDVVYNHFGPEGNYLHAYAPKFFNPRHQTPWGAAINFDGEGSRTVRDFFIHNALFWLEEYHFDGLRLDAVHEIADDSRPDLVDELTSTVRRLFPHRYVHLLLENDRNAARRLVRGGNGESRYATAQWNDDFHHALHALVTGERDGYYADYADRPLHRFARALAEGFVYQGEPSRFRNGVARGEPSATLPPTAFVAFAQNHDQVGNRAFGERIDRLAAPEALRTALTCMLLAPSVPMLFMGEEFAASTPFRFFCDFQGDLAAAVTNGRREEFGRFERFREPANRAAIPDPNAEATFVDSKLDWNERDRSPGAERLAFYRECLKIRTDCIVPLLGAIRRGGTFELVADRVARVLWPLEDGRRMVLLASFAEVAVNGIDAPAGRRLYASDASLERSLASGNLPAYGVVVTLEGSR